MFPIPNLHFKWADIIVTCNIQVMRLLIIHNSMKSATKISQSRLCEWKNIELEGVFLLVGWLICFFFL